MQDGNELWRELCDLERKWEMLHDDGTRGRVDGLMRERFTPVDERARDRSIATQVLWNASDRLSERLRINPRKARVERKRRTTGWKRVEPWAEKMRARRKAA